jgi:L-2-hydroxyglutarate oxidase LhgO
MHGCILDEVNVTIIGAGVVGLAIAAELSKQVNDVVVLERHDSFGRETSSRNSEVIHSGIYYPTGSLKTRLCIEGARLLYALCEQHSISYKKLGKLIVATDESEMKKLETLFTTGKRNGVPDIRMLDRKEATGFSSNFKAFAAIYSPSTGIIDSHGLMKYFAISAQKQGATIAYHSNVMAIEPLSDRFKITVEQDHFTIMSRVVINCAGLSCDAVAALAGIDVEKNGYTLHYCKGSYFSYAKRYPLPMLIYPVPHQELTGLGVHATVDMGGRIRFGPDTEYVDAIDYTVDIAKKEAFYRGAVQLFPNLDKDAFVPDMAGVRPKLSGPDDPVRDFIISDEADNGMNNLIDCIGIESPGLTSSPAIAKMVAAMAVERLK